MLCVKVWLSLVISLLAHFKLIVNSPLISLSDSGRNDHGEKEVQVGGREMKELKIKKKDREEGKI